jgi:hypothetical protein
MAFISESEMEDLLLGQLRSLGYADVLLLKRLAAARYVLLPKLMSGEIRARELEGAL